MKSLWRRGSFTLEASVIIPLFLFMVVTAASLGISLYHESQQTQEQEKTAHIWVVDDFYRLQAVEEAVSQ